VFEVRRSPATIENADDDHRRRRSRVPIRKRTEILKLIGVTNLYPKEAYAIELGVIASA
jgi:hypothetical protein